MTISSIGTTGRTYSTLQAWENACPANLVTAPDTWEGECYNDSEFTSTTTLLTIAGMTTDATHNVQLRCATGQSFRDNASVRSNALDYNASNGVALRSSGNYYKVVDNQVNYSTFDDLQIKDDGNGNAAAIAFQTTGTNTITRNSLIRAARVGWVGSASNSSKLYNVAVIVSGSWDGVQMPFSSAEAIGCTVVRAGGGGAGTAFVTYNYGTALIKDCAGFGFTNFQTGSGGANASSGYNCTDLGTAFGSTGNQVSKTFANQFTNTSADFRVAAGADLINNGNTDSNIDPDISKTTRSGTPTIGCWEYVSAGGGGLPFFMQDDLMVGYMQSLSGGMQ